MRVGGRENILSGETLEGLSRAVTLFFKRGGGPSSFWLPGLGVPG